MSRPPAAPRRTAGGLAAAALVVGAAASIATSAAYWQAQQTEQGPEFTLSESSPTFSQHFTLHVVPEITNENKVGSIDYRFVLTADLVGDGAGSGDSADTDIGDDVDVLVTILSDEDFTLVPQPTTAMATTDGQQVTRSGSFHTCIYEADCESGYTAVFELLTPGEVTGTWEVTLSAEGPAKSDGFVTEDTILEVVFD